MQPMTNEVPLIDYKPTTFDADCIIELITTSATICLFESVANEFGNGELKYHFDRETSSILISIDGVPSSISIADLDPYSTWDSNGESDFIAFRAMLNVDPATVNELNKAHPTVKFYSHGGQVIAEESVYLSHGVSALNLMDRTSSFITTITAINH
ncbi:conserved hypothetical protein [Vibrio crassostreae]|nr:conserved hypothetical protein [Vibrio chagasii]CAK2872613.1 conserved hypothetical protein [Vibrio crassostreae]